MARRLPAFPGDEGELAAHAAEMPPEAHLAAGLHDLTGQWADLGIDADDFLKCWTCGRWLFADPMFGADPICVCPDE
jgi:hypothetical protein